MTTPDHSKHYRADIDGLRAIAVMAVVGFHYFCGVIPNGFVGVDVFFVISGFLISGILFDALANKQFSFVNFYSRRIQRIFPALSLVLLFSLVAGWFLFLPADYAQLGKHVSAGAGFVSNLVLWSEAGYFDQASATKPLLHLWSLGIEEQFYIFYPLILPFIWRMPKAAFQWMLLITATSFFLNVYQVSVDVTATYYLPITRLWELSAGGLIALYCFDGRNESRSEYLAVRNAMSILGLGLILLTTILLPSHTRFPGWWAALPVCGTAALIWAGPQALVNRYFFI